MNRTPNRNHIPLEQPDPSRTYFGRISVCSEFGKLPGYAFDTEEMIRDALYGMPGNVESLAVLPHAKMDKQTSLVIDVKLDENEELDVPAQERIKRVRLTVAKLAIEAADETDYGLAPMKVLRATLVSEQQLASDRLEVPNIESFDPKYFDKRLANAFTMQKAQFLARAGIQTEPIAV